MLQRKIGNKKFKILIMLQNQLLENMLKKKKKLRVVENKKMTSNLRMNYDIFSLQIFITMFKQKISYKMLVYYNINGNNYIIISNILLVLNN